MTTAVLVIDAQASLLSAAWNAEAVIARINDVIAAAREAGSPVIAIRDRRVVPDASLHPAVASHKWDLQIEKEACDAFHGTPLGEELRARGVDRLAIVGMQTEYCVDTTCRRALSEGFDVVLVADAHTTVESEGLPVREIVVHHTRILGNLTAGRRHVVVLPAADVTFR